MIKFGTTDSSLILEYTPDYNETWVEENFENEKAVILRHTFVFSPKHLYKTENTYLGYTYYFIIGKIMKDFYMLDKEVFGITHNFYVSYNINLDIKFFVATSNISIISKIDDLVGDDVYIVKDEEIDIKNRIPYDSYMELINTFPNSTEILKYRHSRISIALRNYIEGLEEYEEKYENFLNKRMNTKIKSHINLDTAKLALFSETYDLMKQMLDESDAYSEKDWQEIISQIILIIYPKYIYKKREQRIGSDGRFNKIPDFILVDSNGFIDVLEIKKPSNQKLITNTMYRKNYIADRDFSGAIVQLEKYIYCLNHGGTLLEEKLNNDLLSEPPENMKIKITNPQGMLLMGRSNNLSEEQLFDLEVIKRQYKNVIDIMTYDDLLLRIKNILDALRRKGNKDDRNNK